MKKSDTLVGAVIYPGVAPYIPDFLAALERQDTKDFDLLVLVDSVPNFELLKTSFNCEQMHASSSATPAGIRSEVILHAVRNRYEQLIFADTDDSFSGNRISASVEHLKTHDFVFNELDLVDEKGSVLESGFLSKIHPFGHLTDYRGIVDFNVLGLSHTAVKVEALKEFEKVEGIVAFDWWLFTTLLLRGTRGKFIPDATTYYRQTASNVVGMMHKLNLDRLIHGIKVKSDHYVKVIKYCEAHRIMRAVTIYSEKLDEMESLGIAIDNKCFREDYISILNNNLNQIFKGWWSEILPLTEWSAYEI